MSFIGALLLIFNAILMSLCVYHFFVIESEIMDVVVILSAVLNSFIILKTEKSV